MPFLKNYRLLIAVAVLFLGISCSKVEESSPQSQPSSNTRILAKASHAALPFAEGETIRYDIKSLGITVGEASLVFNGLQKLGGKDVYLITFTAKAVNFYDEEKIYADINSFYPVMVKRDINIFGKKEKITEEYDQKRGIMRLIKTARAKTTQQSYRKGGMVDNIYCFIYRCRRSGTFKTGDSFVINLPTTNARIDLLKIMPLKIARKAYETYYLESNPSKYKFWFDTGKERIPLKIKGAVGLKDTSMIMALYQKGGNRLSKPIEGK